MLTPNQIEAFKFIQTYIKQYQHAPKLDEIAKGIGVRSRSLISRYVHALAAAELIYLVPGEYRNIRLKEQEPSAPKVPLIGRIAAGKPIEAIPEHEVADVANLLTDNARFKPYALEVQGDSMKDEGIFDGDIILCEPCEVASNGDIVVALIDDTETTLKRIYYSHDTILLIPANVNLKPQSYEPHRVKVQGVYKGLVRMKH